MECGETSGSRRCSERSGIWENFRQPEMEREKWNIGKLQAAGDGAREVEYGETSGNGRWSERSGIRENFRQPEMEREKWNMQKL